MNHDPASPILIFDSGVGGLSVLAEIRKILPQVPVIYTADTAALPYGNKTEAQIAARVPALLGRMVERHHPRLIVIACNTASTIALAAVREALDLPVVGTVPAIKPAALSSETGVIGLLGTEATIRQPYVDDLQRRFAQEHDVLRHPAPALVLAAEAKLAGKPVDPAIVENALRGLRDQPDGEQIDRIVLGCTHFPLLLPELEAAAARLGMQRVKFVDSGEGIARRVAHLLQGQQFRRGGPDRAVFTGGQPAPGLIATLATYGIDAVEHF